MRNKNCYKLYLSAKLQMVQERISNTICIHLIWLDTALVYQIYSQSSVRTADCDETFLIKLILTILKHYDEAYTAE